MHNTYMTDENSFIDHLRKFNDKNWIEVYFDLIAEVIDTTGLRSDDPRIVTSVVRSDAYFPVTINNRYVLASSKHYDNAFIICQREFHNREDLHSGVSYYFRESEMLNHPKRGSGAMVRNHFPRRGSRIRRRSRAAIASWLRVTPVR